MDPGKPAVQTTTKRRGGNLDRARCIGVHDGGLLTT
jgi:hypothetical protein